MDAFDWQELPRLLESLSPEVRALVSIAVRHDDPDGDGQDA